MCKPDYFDLIYSINPWMEPDKNAVNKPLAVQQWQNLVNLMRSLGTNVIEMPGSPELPDLVFTANAGLFFIDKQTLIVSNFKYPERQPEKVVYQKWFEENGYQVLNINSNMFFEGAGDALFRDSSQKNNNELYLGHGFRSDSNFYKTIEVSGLAFTGVYHVLKLVNPYFYHLDTCFCPLQNNFALVCPTAFDETSYQYLKSTNLTLLEVPEEDSKKFACNAVCLENKVIIPAGCEGTKKLLNDAGFEVYDTDMSEYIKSGGACKCLTLRLE